ATGELVQRDTAYAYGAAESSYRPEKFDEFREDYRFTGKEDDVEVGLIYFGKRYYAPLLQRWISPDPLAVHAPGEADLNLYAYVSGQALVAVDPVGLEPEPYVDPPDPLATPMPNGLSPLKWAPGNQPVPWYIGNEAHREIADAVTFGQVAYKNHTPVSTIVGVQGGNTSKVDPSVAATRPDIYVPATGELYEIKPDGRPPGTGKPQAEAQLTQYEQGLSQGGLPVRRGTSIPSAGFVPAPDGFFSYRLASPGVILYRYHQIRPIIPPVPLPKPNPARSPTTNPVRPTGPPQTSPEPASAFRQLVDKVVTGIRALGTALTTPVPVIPTDQLKKMSDPQPQGDPNL
ncbi:MAG: hypothetical protein CVT71_00995, partial [Alphaproteobacteria bacterium HGW-Alphaproteobacteria-10]